MQMTHEKGNFQTWVHDDIIIRVNTQGDIVIIRNTLGEHELIRREPYTAQMFQLIKSFYLAGLSEDYDKKSDANYVNPEGAILLGDLERCDIMMIDDETAFLSNGDTFNIYTPKKGNTKQIGTNKDFPLPPRTRWIMEEYEDGILLHLDSEMTLNNYMESLDAPAIHVYTPTR